MFKSIVVGTDGSETADAAVREASELAQRSGAELHVVSAAGALTGLQLAGAAGLSQAGVWPALAEADKVLEETRDRLSSRGMECEVWAQKGEPADAILKVAEQQHADLIVVGDRGMHGKKRFVLGSVPNKVSHHARCSVLIVHTTAT